MLPCNVCKKHQWQVVKCYNGSNITKGTLLKQNRQPVRADDFVLHVLFKSCRGKN